MDDDFIPSPQGVLFLLLFNWSALSLSRLARFFFQHDSHFFDTHFKISTLVCSHEITLVFFVNEHTFCKPPHIFFNAFNAFYKFRVTDIMFSTCFYHRYNLVRIGTP